MTGHAKCVMRPGQELFEFHSHPSGRTALGLTVRQAAELAGCSHETVVAIESGRSSVKQSTIDKVQAAIEKAGVEFLDDGQGVRLKQKTKRNSK